MTKNFIGHEELHELKEIETMCFFEDDEQRSDFETAVCSSVECSRYEDIHEEKFETAYLAAKDILAERGTEIFRDMIKRSIR